MALIAASAITAATAGYKMYQGHKQKKAGEEAMKGIVKPQYQIPEEVKQNLKESELRALEGLPAAQKAEYVQNIERNQEKALQSSADRKGGLIGLQQASQGATDAFTRLTSMDAEARAENQQNLQQNRMIMAQEKAKQYDEKKDYYQQDLASAQGMIGAGSQNIMSGVDTIGAAANTVIGAKMGAGGEDKLSKGARQGRRAERRYARQNR
jgi:hypothetical protein